LLELRRSRPDLTDPRPARIDVAFDEDERWLLLRRGDIEIAVNIGSASAAVPLRPGPREILLVSTDRAELSVSAVTLPGTSVAVMVVRHV
jgi:maltooligosyltrehalose trehalohydrolase